MASERELLEIVVSPLDTSIAELFAPMTKEATIHYGELARGRLLLQICEACKNSRFPLAPICPYCGADSYGWQALTGRGTIFSWVRYHRAYVAQFAPLVPYVVATIQLDEGPRMVGRLIGEGEPSIGQNVRGFIERSADGTCVLAFSSVEGP